MKHNFIIIFLLVVFLCSCEKHEHNINNIITDDIYNYIEPDYPAKPSGRYLSYIYYDYPTQFYPFYSGKKVEFVFNKKNYVDYFIVFGNNGNSVGRKVKIEYNIDGIATRIKYFNLDSIIIAYEQFNYDELSRLNKISKYEQIDNQNKYELKYFNEFSYPTTDSIIEMRYFKYYNFERPFKDIYILDNNKNVKEKLNYYYSSLYPYSSREFYYNDKKRAFDNLDLPIYEISYDRFQLSEIFSTNHYVGFQNYSYENDSIKTAIGEPHYYDYEYDSLDFPTSRDEIIFYHYIDLN